MATEWPAVRREGHRDAGAAADGGGGPGARRAADRPVAAGGRGATCPTASATGSSSTDLGAWRVSANGGRAEVSEAEPGGELNGDAFAIATDAGTLAQLAAGANPLRRCSAAACGCAASAARRWRCAASRQDAGPRELAKLGLPVDPDLLYRSLPYAIDPEWTRGHSFRIGYELVGEGGGRWTIAVDDGEVRCRAPARRRRARRDRPPPRSATWMRCSRGELTPGRRDAARPDRDRRRRSRR